VKEVKGATVNVRMPENVLNRLQAAADRAGVTRSVWCLEAMVWALELDEAALVHVPAVVQDALPHRVGAKMWLPKGRVFGH
jgi:hypothetical protein